MIERLQPGQTIFDLFLKPSTRLLELVVSAGAHKIDTHIIQRV
jgi:hypothetical protein